MALKLKKKQADDDSAQWFHVGQSEDGRLVGWTDEDEAALPYLREIDKAGRVKVRPFGNRAFEQVQSQLERKNRRFRRNGEFSDEIRRRILFEAAARELLVDWDDFEIVFDDGETVGGDYAPGKGVQAFEAPEFEALIVTLSSDLAEQRRSALREDAEAVGNGSSGKSGGAGKRATKQAASG